MATETSTTEHTEMETKMGRLKLAFLYTLIGGLIVSALISVVAILIGEFNDVVQKALATTFIFVTHSLLVIAIISADKFNRIGKSLLSTTILVSVLANMLTSTIGTWDLWAAGSSTKAFFVYVLAIGTAFMLSGILKLRIAHKPTTQLTYLTAGLVTLLAVVLVPWIIVPEATWVNSFYYRLVGAVTILAATALTVTVIVGRIAIAQKAALAKTVPKAEPHSSGMMAIFITVGVIIAMIWMYGFLGFLISAARSDDTPYQPAPTPRYEKYDYYR